MNDHKLPCEEEFDKFLLKAEQELELQRALIKHQVRMLTELMSKAFEAFESDIKNIDGLG